MQKPEDFFSSLGVKVDEPSDRCGWGGLSILSELKGKPWGEAAMLLVMAFNPSSIRVSYGELKCDSSTNRVTVIVKDINSVPIIQEIWQEKRVPLSDNFRHFHALKCELEATNG